MDIQDPPASRPSQAGSGAPDLRLHDPGDPIRCGAKPRPEPPVPEVAPFLVAGHPFRLIAWTADQWESIPEDRRPGDACRGSKGSWYRFEPDAARSG